jgi:outer membrane lipoprotein SlyB
MQASTILFPALTAAILTGCAATPPSLPPASSTTGTTLVQTAVVTDVRDLSVNAGQYAVPGSLIGGVLGGLAGNALGGGNGRALTTLGGALAGGVAGQRVGQAGSNRAVTRLTVRFDNGDLFTYDVEPGERFQVGDRVRVTSHGAQVTVTH